MRGGSRSIAIAALCGSMMGCNLIFGLDEVTENAAGGNGPGGGAGTGGNTSGGESAGGSTVNGAGGGGGASTGGAGGAGCPLEETAGPGTEWTINGSAEDGTMKWSSSGFALAPSDTSFCGCASLSVTLTGDSDFVFNTTLATLPNGATVYAQARLFAPDEVAAELGVFGDNDFLGQSLEAFGNDADDGVVDGWRLVKAQWVVSPREWNNSSVQVALNGPPDTEVLLDCVSATFD